jgi:hypothetical protein
LVGSRLDAETNAVVLARKLRSEEVDLRPCYIVWRRRRIGGGKSGGLGARWAARTASGAAQRIRTCRDCNSGQKRRTQHYRLRNSEHMTPFRPFLSLVRVDPATTVDNIMQSEYTIRYCAMVGRLLWTVSTACGSSRRRGKQQLRRCRSQKGLHNMPRRTLHLAAAVLRAHDRRRSRLCGSHGPHAFQPRRARSRGASDGLAAFVISSVR